MVRVGLAENVPEYLLNDFPRDGIEIVRLPNQLDSDVEVEFWIPPTSNQAVIAMFPHIKGVKVMQSIMAGVDWILPWLPKDIVLCDGQGLHDIPVAEWVMAAILSSMKRFPEYRDFQNEQFWDDRTRHKSSLDETIHTEDGLHYNPLGFRIMGDELTKKKILIVGYGSIGAEVERLIHAFGVEVLRVARTAKAGIFSIDDLNSLLPQADIVVLLVPLTDETRGLMNSDRFARMKPGALLVNAARGPVVDTEALIEKLQTGQLQAVLDVTDPEPLPKGHPLWSAPNCFITPHVAGSVTGFAARAYKFAAEQVQRYITGESLKNPVNEAGY